MMQTQRVLGDVFSELSQKNPELREEFTYNSETQRVLCKNGETLLGESAACKLSSPIFKALYFLVQFIIQIKFNFFFSCFLKF